MKHLIRNICILGAVLCGLTVLLVPDPQLVVPEEAYFIPVISDVPVADIAEEENKEEEVIVDTLVYNTPQRIEIPAIGVDTVVASVGVSGRAMAVPTNSTDVGWYQLGVKPGNIGSAVLAGHVNWYGGKTAVFTNLHLLAIGDVITVTDVDGNRVQFVVREMRSYRLNDNTADIFISNDGKSHLNLITCDGVWSTIMGTHEERLVVFTDKITEGETQIEYALNETE